MTITFYAQPYDIDACGFYFEDLKDYTEKSRTLRNRWGNPVEEFEIQFIDGEALDCALAQAYCINQANLKQFIECAEQWEDHQKKAFIIAVGEAGYSFEPDSADPDDFDVGIYEDMSMRELTEQFIDDGLFGEIPQHLERYIDVEAIAYDLAMDYTETEIAGQHLIYRIG